MAFADAVQSRFPGCERDPWLGATAIRKSVARHKPKLSKGKMVMRNGIVRKQAAGAVAIVVLSVAMVTTPLAAQGPDSNGQSALVITHLLLPGPAATQMLLERQGAKLLLYVDQGEKQGVAVVDVTTPSRPNMVNRAAWPGRTADGQVQVVGSGLAISELSEGAMLGRRPASQTVNVLDITDPAHPQVLQTFSGVTSILPATARNLIFIANGEGLWIVRHRVGQGAYAMRHLCTSEAALTAEPDCY